MFSLLSSCHVMTFFIAHQRPSSFLHLPRNMYSYWSNHSSAVSHKVADINDKLLTKCHQLSNCCWYLFVHHYQFYLWKCKLVTHNLLHHLLCQKVRDNLKEGKFGVRHHLVYQISTSNPMLSLPFHSSNTRWVQHLFTSLPNTHPWVTPMQCVHSKAKPKREETSIWLL